MAAFSGFAAVVVDAGVAGLSALDLRMPLGVEVPLVDWTVVDKEEVWLTIDGDGATAHRVERARDRVKQVDASDRNLKKCCPGADAWIQPLRTVGPFSGGSCACEVESKQALRIRPKFGQYVQIATRLLSTVHDQRIGYP